VNRFFVLASSPASPTPPSSGTVKYHSDPATKIDPCFLFDIGLGGREEAESLWSNLDDARETLFMLKDSLKFMILKNLNQQ
jgi:hypothetical protein